MSDRRVILGKRLDGSFGMDVSLPGYDALVSDRSDVNKFSFSSDWNDIVKLTSAGIISIPVAGPGTPPYAIAPFPDLGYIPHVEVRDIQGSRVYDDTTFASSYPRSRVGSGAFFDRSSVKCAYGQAAYSVMYFVFAVPLALQ